MRRESRVPNANASTPRPRRPPRGGRGGAHARSCPSSRTRRRAARASAAPPSARAAAARPDRRRCAASARIDPAHVEARPRAGRVASVASAGAVASARFARSGRAPGAARLRSARRSPCRAAAPGARRRPRPARRPARPPPRYPPRLRPTSTTPSGGLNGLVTCGRKNGRAQEPRLERTVEDRQLVVAGDHRLAKGEVDVVAGPRSTASRPRSASEPGPGRSRARPRAARGRTSRPADDRSRRARPTPRTARASSTSLASAASRTALDVLVVLQHRAERLLDDLGVELLPAERGRAPSPSRSSPPRPEASPDRGRAGRARSPPPATARRSGIPGRAADDLDLALDRGVPDPVEQARRLSASCSSRVRFEVSITLGRRRAGSSRARGS